MQQLPRKTANRAIVKANVLSAKMAKYPRADPALAPITAMIVTRSGGVSAMIVSVATSGPRTGCASHSGTNNDQD